VKPLLTHQQPPLTETLPECCLPLARLLTTTEQMVRHLYTNPCCYISALNHEWFDGSLHKSALTLLVGRQEEHLVCKKN